MKNNTMKINLDEEIKQLFEGILSKQESLGFEFSQILQDNRWELYEK